MRMSGCRTAEKDEAASLFFRAAELLRVRVLCDGARSTRMVRRSGFHVERYVRCRSYHIFITVT
jgi:hypothetical protein